MRKKVGVLVSVVIVVAYLLFSIAKYDAYGLKVGVQEDSDIWDDLILYRLDASKDLMRNSTYTIFPNRFGRTVVLEQTSGFGNDLHEAIHEKHGTTILNIRSFSGVRIATHLDFISVENGCTTIYQLVERAGTPTNPNMELSLCQWTTIDGYTYIVRVNNTGTVQSLTIIPPGEKSFLTDAKIQFQWQVRLFYLGLAAVLSVILVCLLVIPKKIEKRKQTA